MMNIFEDFPKDGDDTSINKIITYKEMYQNILKDYMIERKYKAKELSSDIIKDISFKIKNHDYIIQDRYICFISYISEYIDDFKDVEKAVEEHLKSEFDFDYIQCVQASDDYLIERLGGNENKIPVIVYVKP